MCRIRWCPALLVAEGTRTESEGTALIKMHKREFSDNSSQRVIELRSNANKCDWIITKGRYDQGGFAKTLSKQEFFCLFFPSEMITIFGGEKENAKLGSDGIKIF